MSGAEKHKGAESIEIVKCRLFIFYKNINIKVEINNIMKNNHETFFSIRVFIC